MGVRGLWEVVGPVAKPVTLESLANKRLAVDASIWIYQFLKAVRDSNGNVLRNAHIIGFFRRICKLLFFGIKPVFVFDGDAPMLKRQTIARRQERRQGKEESAQKTAAKLLSVQLQKLAEKKARESKKRTEPSTPGDVPDDVVYFDELSLPDNQRTDRGGDSSAKETNKPFRPHDQYHLPQLTTPQHVDQNDPRLMTDEELEEYAKEFQSLATLGLYDTSKVDFNSAEFQTLPKTTQFQLLNVARLRSRLRMGYSADQLSEMFPNKMEFSKFQVQRVAQRNFLTQKILGLVGFEEDLSQRLAGEKGGRYVLKKTDAENGGGWTLALQNPENTSGVISIDTEDELEPKQDRIKQEGIKQEIVEDDEDDDLWETVPIDQGKNNTPIIATIEDAAGSKASNIPELPLSLLSFEDNVQRENLYRKRQEKLKTTISSKPAAPKQKYLLQSEDELLNKLFPVSSSDLRNKPRPASKLQNSITEEPLDFDIPLFSTGAADDKSVEPKQNDGEAKSTTSSNAVEADVTEKSSKKPEVLPPWFIGQSANEFAPSEGVTDHYDRIELSDHEQEELIPMDKVDQFLSVRREEEESDDDLIIVEEKEKSPKDVVAISESEEEKEEVSAVTPAGAVKPVRSLHEENLGESEDEEFEEVPVVSNDAVVKLHDRLQNDDLPNDDLPNDDLQKDDLQNDKRQNDKVQNDNTDDISQEISMNKENEFRELDPAEIELAIADEEFDEEEEEELLENMVKELEESERFTKTLNNGILANRDIEAEIRNLKQQQNKQQRDSDTVTQQMVSECQELLTRFGIPYVTAPMEAEAQCAELISLGLVDGIVTDDSDCFLFGGEKVYKNMFNQSKYVECYELRDIQHELGLNRNKLIQLALLLGSDYTDGLPGVGPVTAVELLAEFNNDEKTLSDFGKWWDMIQKGKIDKEGSEFRKKFRQRFSKKLFIPSGFPDPLIAQAYLQPTVDDDTTKFVWGVPDLDSLRKYLSGATGWTLEKVNELLVPVIQDINKRLQKHKNLAQTTMKDFGTAGLPARKKLEITKSSRMKRAMQHLIDEADEQKRAKYK